MLTRMAPILAVAYCTMVHSGQFGAQMPTRSPRSMPSDMRPRAITSISSLSSPYVHLRVLAMSTSASVSGFARTPRSKFSPIVSSRIGVSVGPASCDFTVNIFAHTAVTDGRIHNCARDKIGAWHRSTRSASQFPTLTWTTCGRVWFIRDGRNPNVSTIGARAFRWRTPASWPTTGQVNTTGAHAKRR